MSHNLHWSFFEYRLFPSLIYFEYNHLHLKHTLPKFNIAPEKLPSQ